MRNLSPSNACQGRRLLLKAKAPAERSNTLSFEKWTLLHFEEQVDTAIAALLTRRFSENRQKDARAFLTLVELNDVDPVVTAMTLQPVSTVRIEDLAHNVFRL